MMNRVIFEDLENVKSRDIPWEKLKGKRVLISGAYGMLASYVTFMLIHLNEEYDYGIQIIALVRSKEKALRRFDEYANKEYFTIRTDSLDKRNQFLDAIKVIVITVNPFPMIDNPVFLISFQAIQQFFLSKSFYKNGKGIRLDF